MLRTEFDLKKKWRVVIYARMSTDRQNPRSPDQQIATIKELMKRMGLHWTIIVIYRDDGISGRLTRKRPQYQQMLRDLKSGKVKADLILVDTFERLSRADDGAEQRRKLQRAGVLVLTADSGFTDPTTTPGKALAMVESIRSTEDGRVKAHNVLRGKKDAIRRGFWPGGSPPLGYRLSNVMTMKNGVEEIDHRVLIPDPETRWIIAELFRLADEKGLGCSRLAQSFNEDPRTPETLKPFHPATVGWWLDSEIYYGELVWGKNCTGIVDDVRILQSLPEEEWERFPAFCEPLVSREVWDRVQALREARRRKRAAAQTTKAENEIVGLNAPGIALKYPLTGLVRCRHCGRSMTPSSSPVYTTISGEERRYVAYLCSGYAGKVCTNGTRISEPWLREVVMKLVRQRLFFEED